MEGTDPVSWELSKENIQPLKQGRNATILSVALDDSATRKLNSVRHEFEEELRTYSGDDPLDVWYRYVLWVEQNFPKGGKDGNLKKLIQKCVTSIHGNSVTDEKYKNDGRFLAIWVKYANIHPYPVDIYHVLESKGFCTSLAEFYISWSWELERLGNYRKADSIYKKGLDVGAVPFDVLQEAHKKFQSRVARATVEGRMAETEQDNGDAQRIALTSLKVQGKKNKVANERVGSSVLGPAGRVAQTQAGGNAGGPTFNIFQDNGSGGSLAAVGGGGGGGNGRGGGSLPVIPNINKENVKDPTMWTKAKVNQKTTGVVPVEEVSRFQKPSFAVHEDIGASQSVAKTPSKLPELSNVLHVRKNFDDWDVPLFVPEPFDPKVQPQYCKHLIYRGTEEFSFEELKAAQYFKKYKEEEEKERAEKERHSQMQQMQDVIKKQEMMIQQLLQMNGNVNAPQQQQQKVPSGGGIPQIAITSPQETNRFSLPKKFKGNETRDRSNFHDSWISMNKSVTASVNASTANVSHFLDESSTCALLQLKPATLTPLGDEPEVSEEPEQENASASAPNLSNGQDISNSNSSHSNSRGLNLTDPTVNTKMAMNAMNEMWSVSLFKDNSVVAPDIDVDAAPVAKQAAAMPFSIFQDNAKSEEKSPESKASSQQPFSIFSDGNAVSGSDNSNSQAVKPAPAFSIFQDEPKPVQEETDMVDCNDRYPENQDENKPPPGFKQEKTTRAVAGILKPATNVPFCPIEDQKEEEEMKEKKPEVGEAAAATTAATDGAKDSEICDDDYDDIFPLNGTVLADFTLKMPNNPEMFAKDAKIVSTPAWSLSSQACKSDTTMGALIKTTGNFIPIDEEEKEEESSGELMPPPGIVRVPEAIPLDPVVKPSLSPIMEASREYRSSSSSSSGNSTTSTTFGSISTLGHTQSGAFSVSQTSRLRHSSNPHTTESALEPAMISQAGDATKSGYFADRSRGESLAESRPNISSQHQAKTEEEELTFDPQQAAMMLFEMDGLPPASAPTSVKSKEPKEQSVLLKAPQERLSERINPFDEELLSKLLSSLREKVEKRGGYVQMEGKVPQLKPNMQLSLGKEMFHVRRLRGEGAYAKVFQAATMDPLNVTVFPAGNLSEDDDDDDDEQQMILKSQKPACPWEFYICHELRSRLKANSSPTNMLDSMMRINRGYFYSNGSILVSEYHKYGTLLDVVNRYKLSGKSVPEELVILFMIEVLSIVEALRDCEIIHADIKPDNFLVREVPFVSASVNTPEEVFKFSPCSLKLIDFGRSIDMRLFPEGTTFTEQVTTEGFTCCEMREGKPWTYETDLYGVAAIAYCFLFGSYMDVKKNTRGKWELKGATIKRYWQRDLWQSLFSTLLNAPTFSAVKQLKVDLMRKFFELGMHTEINVKIKDLTRLLTQKK